MQQVSPSTNSPKNKQLYLMWVPFVIGICTMGIEIAISRLLTPYFGSSLYMGTSLTSALMLCLSMGYHIGGYIADKYVHEKLVYTILLGAGIYISLLPGWASACLLPMVSWLTTYPFNLFLVSFIATLLLVGIPLVLIGMLTPPIIQLSAYPSTEKFGRIIGKITAYATLGSIIGTLIATFLALPFLGTKNTILYNGLLLVTAAIAGFLIMRLKNTHHVYQESR